ncbi:molecular chaperone HtpG, partial [Arthrospira platensis SPKY1]|nr:molecular chaperone HtpG [Arthrospira platensis SPKY1]
MWSCEGSPRYTLNPVEKTGRGTDIVLHINEENKEFLEEERIRQLLNKYCKFLPVPIQFGTEPESEAPRIVNNTHPIWKKSPADLKDEDYLGFYEELYPFSSPPMFWIHLNIDYPFNLTGILYFPRLTQSLE